MATVREHLKTAHAAMAEHHRNMASCHGEAMGKADDPHHAFHKSAKAEHEAAAQTHDDMCNECAKAAESDLNKIQPLPHGFSRVAPTHTPVPRTGAPPLQVPAVDDEFSKALGLDAAEWHTEEESLRR